ncbi:MAG TPA: VCBS repeat-containing protein [Acidimicrobiia bacterium]|jgi:hypothetical protein
MNRVFRGLLAPVLIAAGLVATTAATSTATAKPAHAATSTPTLAWNVKTSGRLHQSAPVIADLNGDGIPEIIVGDLNGLVHAYEPNGHGELAGWPQYARPDGVHPTAVESAPAVADLFNNGQKEVIVGATSVWVPNQQGGLVVFDAHGRMLWHWQGIDYITIWGTTSFHHDGYTEGAIDTPAIGDVDGDGYPDIVFGGLDARIHALNRFGHELAGFPVQADDTVWSSPALYDVFHSGQDEIFIGSPSTGGGPQPHMGGTMYGLADVHGTVFTMWRQNIAESLDASPAIAEINGRMAAITTTGWAFNNSEQQDIFAWYLDNGSVVPGYPINTGTTVAASVALGDVNGDGQPDIVVGGWDGLVRAYTLSGHLIWRESPFWGPGAHPSRIEGSAIIADVNGDGRQDVVVPTDTAVYVLDGRTGKYIAGPLGNNFTYQNSPAIENTPTGRILVIAGMQGGYPLPEASPSAYGELSVYSLGPTSVAPAWPSWRHDARRTGVATTGPPRPKWASPSTSGLTLFQRAIAPTWSKARTGMVGAMPFDLSDVETWSTLPPQAIQLHVGQYHIAV